MLVYQRVRYLYGSHVPVSSSIYLLTVIFHSNYIELYLLTVIFHSKYIELPAITGYLKTESLTDLISQQAGV